MIEKIPFETHCEDGVRLRGLVLKPSNPKAIVQFNAGTATKKEFYLPFLMFLAENGYLCCLWDYRGSGESAPEQMKECHYTYREYGIKDMPTIKKYLESHFPGLPILVFAHSAGGQQIGLMENIAGYQGMVCFAVSTGYFPGMPFIYRMKAYFFFYLFTPLSIKIFGYVKAKKFGFMEDLPKEVVMEWRRWCAKKNYFFDTKFANQTVPVNRYKKLPFPVHVFWTPDDEISAQKNTHTFWSHINSPDGITFQELKPADFGIRRIEHFGFFKKRMQESLWPLGLEKLDAFFSTKLKYIGS